MKIHVLSDLHLEFSIPHQSLGDVQSDVVVLAGDIGSGVSGIEWAGETWSDRPVIYVAGNHEFYRREYNAQRRNLRQAAEKFSNVTFLDRDAVVINDVLFIGATLWTNFEYFGRDDIVKRASAMSAAAQYMNDFRLIQISEDCDGSGRRLMPEDTTRIFEIESAYIRDLLEMDLGALADQFGVDAIRKRVVVTHHLPSEGSVHPRFAESELNAAFASHIDETVKLADLWIHGHTHDSCDYTIGGRGSQDAMVVCNPRGYSRYHQDVENFLFDSALVVEI